MPKRRTPSPAQKAALAKAQAVSAAKRRKVRTIDDQTVVPQGKTRLLYHSTSEKNAKKILENGFKAKKADADNTGTVFFANRPGHIEKGSATLVAKVSRKSVISRHTRRFDDGTEWLEVHPKDLRGIKVKRKKAS